MSESNTIIVGILLAALNAAVAGIALLAGDDYVAVTNLASLSCGLFGCICLCEIGNLLFLARTFILALLGYFPMVVKILLGPDAEFSIYERSTQGFDVVTTMYVVTSFALLSNQIGLALAKQQRGSIQPPPRVRRGSRFGYWTVAGLAGIALAVFSSLTFIRGYGEFVTTAGYGGAEQSGEGLPFGSVGILGAVGIFSLFIAGLRKEFRFWHVPFAIICVLFIVFGQLLMGLRQDAMSVLFGLVVLYGLAQGRELALRLVYVPVIVVGYAFFEIWGVARTALAAGATVTSLVQLTFATIGTGDAVRLGTVSALSGTFANTVYMLKQHTIEFTLGKSYLEWFLRIPPEAIYPDRPKDYAVMFEQYGLMSGGGFFELAEVYMNFGLLGAFVIPGIISYLMAKSYYYALTRQTMLSYFVLFSFLSIFLRGTWYQTFAFFRAFLVCLILYGAYVFASQVLSLSVRRKSAGHSGVTETVAAPRT